ncbi:MAG: quinone oxidoreductase [Candidatus Lambdaproteobacteria bacterium]|nr:quinone oxidoreductase [Candidatus Lambdaproteobacteria bacterium]
MKAIRIHENGGSDKLKLEDIPKPAPGEGQAVVKLEAIGINFIDTYQRSGLYKMPLPFTLGSEGAGTVEAVGSGVSEVKAGDRVAYTGVLGSYAEYAAVPAARLVKLPAGVAAEAAAAAMLQGLTAHYLCHDTYPLKPNDTCLVHAGAGGVGLLLIQLCHRIGARVVTTVSTEEKAKLAREAGADHVVLYTKQDFVEETLRFTGGKKLDVVYDSVGQTSFMKGLDLLRPRGMMVLYGQSSGPVPPIDLNILNGKGSLYVTRPSLAHHIASREALLARATAVLEMSRAGSLKLRIGKTYPLAQARQAQDDLEGRRSTGKLLLLP